MTQNLLFSLGRVAPFFLLILLGWLMSSRGWVPEEFFRRANHFVYSIALPINLFYTMATPNGTVADPFFLLFVLGMTLLSFLLVLGVTELVYKDKTLVGTLVQGGFRGNFVLLGTPLVLAVAGEAAAQIAALSMVVVIPLYNSLSVIILMVRGNAAQKPDVREILKGIVTNRLILAILLALPLFLFQIRLPYVVDETMRQLSGCAMPLGLLSIGGLFQLRDATARLRPAIYATTFKILLLPLIFLPLAYILGFTGNELLVIFTLLASPTAVSSYAMACAMGGDGPLASNILILTTFFSAFGFAAGIYLLRTFSLI